MKEKREQGGHAPNVVPDYAQAYYYARRPDAGALLGIRERIEQARGQGFVYTPLIGEREPPLDYRVKP